MSKFTEKSKYGLFTSNMGAPTKVVHDLRNMPVRPATAPSFREKSKYNLGYSYNVPDSSAKNVKQEEFKTTLHIPRLPSSYNKPEAKVTESAMNGSVNHNIDHTKPMQVMYANKADQQWMGLKDRGFKSTDQMGGEWKEGKVDAVAPNFEFANTSR